MRICKGEVLSAYIMDSDTAGKMKERWLCTTQQTGNANSQKTTYDNTQSTKTETEQPFRHAYM